MPLSFSALNQYFPRHTRNLFPLFGKKRVIVVAPVVSRAEREKIIGAVRSSVLTGYDVALLSSSLLLADEARHSCTGDGFFPVSSVVVSGTESFRMRGAHACSFTAGELFAPVSQSKRLTRAVLTVVSCTAAFSLRVFDAAFDKTVRSFSQWCEFFIPENDFVVAAAKISALDRASTVFNHARDANCDLAFPVRRQTSFSFYLNAVFVAVQSRTSAWINTVLSQANIYHDEIPTLSILTCQVGVA